MKALRDEGFPVPLPVGQSRHTVVMELIDAFPLRQIESVPEPAMLYSELMDIIVSLAKVGLIHGDFNEFNILIKEERQNSDHESQAEASTEDKDLDGEPQSSVGEKPEQAVKLVPIVIDFPQMLSITHENAAFYFDRDVACIRRFFSRRFHFEADEAGPFFADAIKDSNLKRRLDIEVEATGFSRKLAKDLDKYIEAIGANPDHEQDEIQDEDDPEIEQSMPLGNDEEGIDHDSGNVETGPPLEHAADHEQDFPDLSHRLEQSKLDPSAEPSTDSTNATKKVRTKKQNAGWSI